MTPNPFKAALGEGQLQLGFWQALASPLVAELCAGAGFDWLLLDGEHGPNTLASQLAQLQAISGHNVHAVGRVPVGETWIIKQYLDIGFTTLLVPMVDTAEQAAQIVRACRYPPNGVRGVGSGIVRASAFNRTPGYLGKADDQICVLVQVETLEGLKNLDAIAATEGVDGVFIGPADLSGAMGFLGKPGAPEVQDAIASAFQQVRAAGKAVGILTADRALAKGYIAMGFTFVAVGSDVGLFVKATDELLGAFRDTQQVRQETGSVY